MSKQLAPFHFDIVGSFLRPAELKEAREAFTKGNITREELTAVEDRLITDLIQNKKQQVFLLSLMVNSAVHTGT